jgi:hypothetical protein
MIVRMSPAVSRSPTFGGDDASKRLLLQLRLFAVLIGAKDDMS